MLVNVFNLIFLLNLSVIIDEDGWFLFIMMLKVSLLVVGVIFKVIFLVESLSGVFEIVVVCVFIVFIIVVVKSVFLNSFIIFIFLVLWNWCIVNEGNILRFFIVLVGVLLD